MITLDYIMTNLGAKVFDFCAYIVKKELPKGYLYEFVANSCVTHAIIRNEKLEDARRILSEKGIYLVRTR